MTVLNGFHHVGLSVVNIDRSVSFYRDLLGMEVVTETPFGDERYESIMALQGATGRVAVLTAGSLRIELFEFGWPAPRPREPDSPVCDHGITHFCFEVTDLEYVYQRLKMAGVRFHCPPLTFVAGLRATYARDPDGNVFEMIEDRR